jgi:ABC-type polysaccharide/polyol phosphate transport system ATPase subunit
MNSFKHSFPIFASRFCKIWQLLLTKCELWRYNHLRFKRVQKGGAVCRRKEAVLKNIIEIEHLNKQFGDVHAVQDLSFRVREGELFAFLGVNGAGKSTTINIMYLILVGTVAVLIGIYILINMMSRAKKS